MARIGLGLSVCDLTTPAYDPAGLSLTGWWRASYSGSPWTGVASAGSSGARNLTGGTAPSVGSAVNGLTPADCNGSTQSLTNATAMTTLVSDSAGMFAALFYADTAAADGGDTAAYAQPGLVCEATNGFVYFAYGSAGVSMGGYNGAHNRVAVSASTGAWHLAVGTWDSTKVYLSVDGGSFSSISHTIFNGPDGVNVGQNYSGSFFDGRIAEVMIGAFTATSSDVANLLRYVNARYALSL